MSLLIRLWPFYVAGNLHCLGMCGPLVMLIGMHRHRNSYFFGRMFSFTLAGLMAGAFGAVAQGWLHLYRVPAFASLTLAFLFFSAAAVSLFRLPVPRVVLEGAMFKKVQHRLSLLMLRDHPFPLFLLGVFTIALPCGQTLLVYTACALEGEMWSGLINGAAFAALTTPSLWTAMRLHRFFASWRGKASLVTGCASLTVAILCLCRGLADLDVIPHFIVSSRYHLALF